MVKTSKTSVTENKEAPVKYKTDVLLNSKAFSGYQKDFARALLTEPEYTLEEAREVLDHFFGKEGD